METFNPVSTYRLQFNRNFTFNDAEKILPYLYKLGIKTIYASPVLKALKGSNHGYDVTNPMIVNPETGTRNEFENLLKKVHQYGMGWIQDIVPNHMSFSTENPWIVDVLEKGKDSEYYEFFDIIENHSDPNLKNKLMLPFFGKPVTELIESGELSVVYRKDGFKLKYFDDEYPLSVPAYPVVLKAAGRFPVPEPAAGLMNSEISIDRFDETRRELSYEHSGSDDFRHYITECLTKTNSSPDILKAVVDKLHYYPSFWRDTETRINYRRFFTINSLICLNIQNEKVFNFCHLLIEEWLKNKMVDGVRVDHIDGLFNPAEYLERLRKMAGNETAIYVEKILEEDELLPGHWPVQGSTGYDFLSLVNNLLTNKDNGPVFSYFYNDWIHKPADFNDVFYKNNRFILYRRLAGELENLTRQCLTIDSVNACGKNEQEIKAAIGEFLVACPVYKVYLEPSKFTEYETDMVKMIGEAAIKNNPDNEETLKILIDLFLLKLPGSKEESIKADAFFRRCMQFTGPLMAKGIEDTAFYSYNPFIGHNEVGDSPSYFGISTEKFHQAMEERMKNNPLTQNAVSTHDTKRGEDARARLNVLSDMPVTWMDEARRWREINSIYKKRTRDKEIPSANDEYLIYQVLCAHLPMNATADETFIGRLQEYFIKAIREAKVNSSWSDPDESYENETMNFISNILSAESHFPAQMTHFMEELIPHGIVNSITQVILKNTVPGVPDTFQGTETWNLYFVDPDNRRPVDYLQLAENLDELEKDYATDATALAKRLFSNPLNGTLKHWATWTTLQERLKFPDLFFKGSYIPLKVLGKYHKRVIAFYRNYSEQHLIVILPLSTITIDGDNLWEDTRIRMPGNIPPVLKNLLTGTLVETGNILNLENIFDIVPFAVLRNS